MARNLSGDCCHLGSVKLNWSRICQARPVQHHAGADAMGSMAQGYDMYKLHSVNKSTVMCCLFQRLLKP